MRPWGGAKAVRSITCPNFQQSSTFVVVKRPQCGNSWYANVIDEERRQNGRVCHAEESTAQEISAGEGIIKDLSLSGSYITGNAPVSVGMALALQIFVPGDPEPLLIDPASVKWVKGSEFGIDFDTPQPKVAERITQVISTLVKTQHGSSRKG